MNVIAVDDKQPIVEDILNKLRTLEMIDKAEGFTDPFDALEYVKHNQIDVAFLDVEMPLMSELELAKVIKDLYPETKIIFITGYCEYAINAFKVRASGYLLKPVKLEELKEEIENILLSLPKARKRKIFIKTFGNFDVFVDDKPVLFKRSRAKELFAYLVDKKGSSVTVAEIAAMLWGDKPYDRIMQNSTQSIISYMMQSLRQAGIAHIVNKQWNSISLNVGEVECDYYEFLKMNTTALNEYAGEYMSQYSWTETTAAMLWHRLMK